MNQTRTICLYKMPDNGGRRLSSSFAGCNKLDPYTISSRSFRVLFAEGTYELFTCRSFSARLAVCYSSRQSCMHAVVLVMIEVYHVKKRMSMLL